MIQATSATGAESSFTARCSAQSDRRATVLAGMELLFEIATPLGFTVRCSRSYWDGVLLMKHPVLRGREEDVRAALRDPDEVRHSRKDPAVLLFYRGGPVRWTCAVTKVEGGEGFLVTAYPTDAIKIGETIWTRSR